MFPLNHDCRKASDSVHPGIFEKMCRGFVGAFNKQLEDLLIWMFVPRKICWPRRAFVKRYLPSSKSPVLPLLVVRMWNVFLVDASLHAHQLLGRDYGECTSR